MPEAGDELAKDRRSWLAQRLRPRFGGTRTVSLALQGGGSFGAFTWGVLDHLLESGTFRFDTISGSSAGAVNAALLADGLARGGREAARQRLERFWRRVSSAAALGPFGRAAATAFELSSRVVSPYQFNPLGLNPLRDILAEEIDFAGLRAAPLRLIIAATRVRDGRVRLFRNDEITLDAIIASAALPHLHHAVEIDGEWYWDGGYSANPPLRALVLESAAADVLLVQITPEGRDAVPRLSPQISRQVNEITFNGPLQREVEVLAELTELCRKERFFRSRLCRKLRRLRLHRVAAEASVDGLHRESAFNLDWSFLTRLKASGRAAAQAWLATCEA